MPQGVRPGTRPTDPVRVPETPRPPGFDPTPEQARDLVDDLIPTVVHMWTTAYDDRVCPVCGPLAGVLFSEHMGPFPPLHNNCRCVRVYHHTDYSRRPL